MKKKIILSSVIAVGLLYAADPVPFIFSTGDVIKASEMNSNFQKLVDYISTLELKVSTLEAQVSNLQSSTTMTTRKFVGMSDTDIAGNSGIMTLNNECNVKYSGSTMCTTEEIFYSPQIANAGGKDGWVQPTSDNGKDLITGWNYLSCQSGPDGYYVDATTGTFGWTASTSLYSCADLRPVACCK